MPQPTLADLPRGELITDLPPRRSDISPAMRSLGTSLLRVSGWTAETSAPAVDKMVLIGYPHTSNLDFPYMLFAGAHYGIRPYWFGKAALFDHPLGFLMEAMGGIKIDRSKPGDVVSQLVARFDAADRMVLLVPAEGTRSRRDYWKSGFYHIAHGADVPIGLTHLDYGGRRLGIGAVIRPSGDIAADMALIRAYYEGVAPHGRFPGQESPIRLRSDAEG